MKLLLKDKIHKHASGDLKGRSPFKKLSSLSPYEGERDKG